MPAVSIITPLYNTADRIQSCIASVQSQTLRDYEHLVIDNMSTDGGAEIARREAAQDHRIRVLANSTGRGAGPTRNIGIAEAKGRYIAFLDADDLWKPEKLERQIAHMEATGSAFSWSAYDVYDRDGAFLRTQSADPEISYDDLLRKRTVVGCLTAIYDTSHLGKKYMANLPMRQDFCLWLDIIRTCDERALRFSGLPDSLAEYTAGGMTSDKKKAAMAQWHALRHHLRLPVWTAASAFGSYVYHALRDRA